MINPGFYDIDHEIERIFLAELKKELYQPPTGFHAALQDQQTQYKHLSLRGFRNILQEIQHKYAGKFPCDSQLQLALESEPYVPQRSMSDKKIRTNSWFSEGNTQDTSSDSEEDTINFKNKIG